ncbi:MAG: DUF5710 domain-containing protein [Streptosporangiaceae bacterium]
MSARAWLDVPYRDKDLAKASGARWNPGARRWYAPRHGVPALDRWVALADLPQLLPGEDRQFGSGLLVDLVPSSCWFIDVRSCVEVRECDRPRRVCRDAAVDGLPAGDAARPDLGEKSAPLR